MGLFDKLVSKLIGNPSTAARVKVTAPSAGELIVSATDSGARPEVHVSDAESAGRVEALAYVFRMDLPPVRAADQWWNEETYKRRLREGSELIYAWLLPFIPIEVAKLDQIQKCMQWGPHGAGAIAKELRAIIRERRKAKQPYVDLLQALYGVSVISDLSASLAFEGTQSDYMVRFVSFSDLQGLQCDYATMGYQCSESLSKTDIKWLVEALGEPSEHQSFNALFPHIQRNAISRYCWAELRRQNESSKGCGLPEKSMQQWLNELVKRNIGYHKEWQERVAARQVQLAERSSALDAAWAATEGTFVVADLETTGLRADSDEVLEFAAVMVNSSGAISAEFSTLVRVKQPVPSVITKITGISQTDVDREGRPLPEALAAFIAFVGSHPVFFHNAPFDVGFLKQAGSQARLKFTNPVHDTLPIAWSVWPSLGTYKLGALAEHVGALAPTHRGVADAKAALAVLMAARAKVKPLTAT